MYLEVLIFLFLFFTVFFLIGQFMKNNSVADAAWGLGFVLTAWYLLIRNSDRGFKSVLITACITVWGMRLTYHITNRNMGKQEDYRYAAMRKQWGNHFVALRSFLYVYMMQMLIQYLVSLPVIYGNLTAQKLRWYNWLGLLIWAVGFFFESYGDYQLKLFKKDPANKGRLMDQGLWSLTRHPNYFGDSTMWFGIFLLAVSDWHGLWTIFSPCLMTYFLIFVSGVRLLEKKYRGREDFEAYKQKTSAFFPWFPGKAKEASHATQKNRTHNERRIP